MLAFTSVYFLESGLINGLRPFGVKKFPLPSERPPFTSPERYTPSLLSQHPHAIRFWFGDRKQYKTDFGLEEEIVCIFWIHAAGRRSPSARSPHRWNAPIGFPVILAAFALAGCNANQAVNPSSQPPSQVFAGHYRGAPVRLQSHGYLRAEQHRPRPRTAEAAVARRRPTAPRIVELEDANADPDHSGFCGARALRLQRQSGDQSLGDRRTSARTIPAAILDNPSSYAQNNVGIGR